MIEPVDSPRPTVKQLHCAVTDDVTEVRKNFRRIRALLHNYGVNHLNDSLAQIELYSLRAIVDSPTSQVLMQSKRRSEPA